MHRKIHLGSAIVLLVAATAALALVVREYRRGMNAFHFSYTRSVKKHDVADAARNALSALEDAELREQNYVLTGETVYSEAYADDIRKGGDELAVLDLVAGNDPATPLAQEFSTAGKRTLSELAQIVSTYEKNGRDAAIERIRKGSGIVYLDQARGSAAKILELDGGALALTNQIVDTALLSLRRIAAGAVVLFFLTFTGALLLILPLRGRV